MRPPAGSRSEKGLRIDDNLVLVGDSPGFRRVIDNLLQVACHDVPVLIEGETGTGKELIAQALHRLSKRQSFIEVNCAALPAELAESEFFGHVRGAFTDARDGRSGLVTDADGGTLFLDEVSSLSLDLQAKLLRFLQNGTYREVGGNQSRFADVRVVAATNVPLTQAIAEARFRRDLYYRLAVYRIEVPPLRERFTDIDLLAAHFLTKHNKRLQLSDCDFSPAGMSFLRSYHWPGNVRELENVIQHALICRSDDLIEPPDLQTAAGMALAPVDVGPETGTFQELKAAAIRDFERSYIQRILLASNGNVTHAARMAGMHRRTLTALLAKHGIRREQFVSQRANGAGSPHQ